MVTIATLKLNLSYVAITVHPSGLDSWRSLPHVGIPAGLENRSIHQPVSYSHVVSVFILFTILFDEPLRSATKTICRLQRASRCVALRPCITRRLLVYTITTATTSF